MTSVRKADGRFTNVSESDKALIEQFEKRVEAVRDLFTTALDSGKKVEARTICQRLWWAEFAPGEDPRAEWVKEAGYAELV
jgi:hypothetical protein